MRPSSLLTGAGLAAQRLRWASGLVLIVLVVASTVRYVDRHRVVAESVPVLLGALVLVLVHSARPLLNDRSAWATRLWLAAVLLVWGALTLRAPSFAWTAVPLAFSTLLLLPFAPAVAVIAAMTGVVSLGAARMGTGFDPTTVAGPIGIAVLAVLAHRVLQEQTIQRQRLLDDLHATRDELAVAERRSGALAERARLSREIHDSVGQELTSITLLLHAAQDRMTHDTAAAGDHVAVATQAASRGLDEVRRVVRDLAPSSLADADLAAALRADLGARIEHVEGLTGQVRVHGVPAPVDAQVQTAILRTASGAVANVVEHAQAHRVVVSLTYLADEVRLDVRDDGCGFDISQPPRPGTLRGHGVAGMQERARSLGGKAWIESAPGDGTCVSLAFTTTGRTP